MHLDVGSTQSSHYLDSSYIMPHIHLFLVKSLQGSGHPRISLWADCLPPHKSVNMSVLSDFPLLQHLIGRTRSAKERGQG